MGTDLTKVANGWKLAAKHSHPNTMLSIDRHNILKSQVDGLNIVQDTQVRN